MRAGTRTFISVVIVAVLAAAVFAGSSPKDDKNARENLIKAARFLEEKPFDKHAKRVRTSAIKWIIRMSPRRTSAWFQTDMVSVKACWLLVGVDEKYKYSSEVFDQYTIGMTAFKLANPANATDESAARQAGLESALTSYEAMVKERPKAKNVFLDGLVAKRVDGSLAQYVAENNCKDNK